MERGLKTFWTYILYFILFTFLDVIRRFSFFALLIPPVLTELLLVKLKTLHGKGAYALRFVVILLSSLCVYFFYTLKFEYEEGVAEDMHLLEMMVAIAVSLVQWACSAIFLLILQRGRRKANRSPATAQRDGTGAVLEN